MCNVLFNNLLGRSREIALSLLLFGRRIRPRKMLKRETEEVLIRRCRAERREQGES